MAIDIRPIQRAFRYNGIALPDVPGLDPRKVRDFHSAQYPELVSAEVEAVRSAMASRSSRSARRSASRARRGSRASASQR